MKNNLHPDEHKFLEGPHSRRHELVFAIKVFFELVSGFRKFHFLGPCATVFGSARFGEDHPYYKLAEEMGASLAGLGFAVMTGGGPGIMEAANKGAQRVGGKSVGCNIILPKEQKPNKYLDYWININYFFLRKVLLFKYSYAFIVMPGGYGTLDEFFESITLIQTGKMKHFPVVLIGKEYHRELYEYLQTRTGQGTISPRDLELFLFTDSVEEATQYLQENAIKHFNLESSKTIKPIRLFGEVLKKFKRKD